MSTVHATYPTDTLNRLETMALMGDVQLPLSALRSQLASAVDIIVQMTRLSDGSRVVTHLTEVVAAAGRRYRLIDIFNRDAAGALRMTGRVPQCAQALAAMGIDWPCHTSEVPM